MKNTITFVMLFAMAVSMHADLVLKTKGFIEFCPSIFTISGTPVAYSFSENKATIYTSDFLVDRTFILVKSEYQYGSFTEQATVTPTGLIALPESSYDGKNYSVNKWIVANSQEEMISKIKENYPSTTWFLFTDPMGNFACYNYDSYSYKYENLFGKKYPTSWFALIDGYICSISTYDSFYTIAYDDENVEWTRTSEDITAFNENPYDLDIIMGCLEGGDVRFSQNLFNTDDKWEYIVREYGPLEYYYSSSQVTVNDDGTVIVTRSGSVSSSGPSDDHVYSVYNEDGTKLGVLPKGVRGIYIINGKRFFEAYDYKKEEACLYEIKGDLSDFDLVETVRTKDERRLGAIHGIVIVDIDAEQAGGEVVVSTTEGKVLASKKVGIGQTQINGQPLPAGIYVVSLIKDGLVVESEKYLVQ